MARISNALMIARRWLCSVLTQSDPIEFNPGSESKVELTITKNVDLTVV